jgi:hypothetical protein
MAPTLLLAFFVNLLEAILYRFAILIVSRSSRRSRIRAADARIAGNAPVADD